MKKILLDTHILLWYFDGNPRLAPKEIDIITDMNHFIYFSCVSIAEMALKASLNKLIFPEYFVSECLNQEFIELPLLSKHSEILKDLAMTHKDPFDRMLIAQSLSEDMYFMTHDKQIKNYSIKLIS